MANKSATVSELQGGKGYKWDDVTEADTMLEQQVEAGKYTVTVDGTFGGTSIEIKYGAKSGVTHSIDTDNLVFTAAGSYNIECARGFILPVRTGGTSTNVDINLSPIPRS